MATTEEQDLLAGTNAVLKVVSQPAGATSGALLKEQPAVQLEDRDGRILHEKVKIVATIAAAGIQKDKDG